MGYLQVIGEETEGNVAWEIVAWLDFFAPTEGVFGVLKQFEYEMRALGVAVGEIAAVEVSPSVHVSDGVFG